MTKREYNAEYLRLREDVDGGFEDIIKLARRGGMRRVDEKRIPIVVLPEDDFNEAAENYWRMLDMENKLKRWRTHPLCWLFGHPRGPEEFYDSGYHVCSRCGLHAYVDAEAYNSRFRFPMPSRLRFWLDTWGFWIKDWWYTGGGMWLWEDIKRPPWDKGPQNDAYDDLPF